MSRHGLVDDYDCDDLNLAAGRWIGRVKQALRGKRGQAFLTQLVAALDAMPVKELHPHSVSGDCLCAMGALAAAQGILTHDLQEELDDPDGDHEWATEVLGDRLNIAPSLAREVAYENDEVAWKETPALRWERMRRWAVARIKKEETL